MEQGRALVARQRQLIAEIESKGGDASGERRLLRRFEKNLDVFFADHDALIKKYAGPDSPKNEGEEISGD